MAVKVHGKFEIRVLVGTVIESRVWDESGTKVSVRVVMVVRVRGEFKIRVLVRVVIESKAWDEFGTRVLVGVLTAVKVWNGPRYRWGSQMELGLGSGLSLKLRSGRDYGPRWDSGRGKII
jgi:hypothetical protein